MPEAFVSGSSSEANIDSPENLLIWLSTRPFLDPKTGCLLTGSGGVSFSVYLILRVLITARYLVDCPSVFTFSVNPRIAIQRIRPVVRACVLLLLSDLHISMEELRRTTEAPPQGNWGSFIPYPQRALQNTLLDSSSNTIEHRQTQGESSNRSKQAKRGVQKPKINRPEVTSQANATPPEPGRVHMVPPWHTFFEEIFAKAGKPLPEQLCVVIQKGKSQPNGSVENDVQNISNKTSKLRIQSSAIPSRNAQPNASGGKRVISITAENQLNEKRMKNEALHRNTSEEEEREYICLSD
ncbi:hypothetical protein FRC11_001558 [Ceratobasidium sp. 423]|nr:hypothetical protein FRC11_001558 [Ceratobasidium sp. 423]